MQKLLSYFVAIIFFLSLPQAVFAAKNSNKLEIIIQGNERVDKQTIESFLDINGLEKNNQTAINNSLKKLFESDLFLETKIAPKNDKMIIEVKENPIVNEIEFRGNKKIDKEALQAEIKLAKRAIYTKAKLQADIKRISDIYIKSGRFLAKIEPKIVKKDQNRIDLIFDIKEGKKADIAEINFIGNKVFADNH
jgi:outer membrane protein insertion porin family